MPRQIILTRLEQSVNEVAYHGSGFRLRVEATGAVLMPAEIFLHKKTKIRSSGAFIEEFVAVAASYELGSTGLDPDVVVAGQGFYRKSTLDITLPHQQLVEQVWESISTQVDGLINELNRKDRLVVRETRHLNGNLSDDSSDSS